MTFVLHHEVEIETAASRVWEVVSNLAAYREWNPFVVDARSSLVVGEPFWMKVRVFPFFAQPQRETIFACEPGRSLQYGIAMPLAALSSRRSNEIVSIGRDRARYVSHFELSGWLAPLVEWVTGRRLSAGFADMTLAVKERAERLEARERAGPADRVADVSASGRASGPLGG